MGVEIFKIKLRRDYVIIYVWVSGFNLVGVLGVESGRKLFFIDISQLFLRIIELNVLVIWRYSLVIEYVFSIFEVSCVFYF